MWLNKAAYHALSVETEDLVQCIEVRRRIIFKEQKFFLSLKVLLILNNYENFILSYRDHQRL